MDACNALLVVADQTWLGKDTQCEAFLKLVHWDNKSTKDEKSKNRIFTTVVAAIKATKVS